MKKSYKNFLSVFLLHFVLLLSFVPFFAAHDDYLFTTEQYKQRFKTLTSELRCLVCQNQNLAESNAALAIDLRELVYQQIQHGQSDKQIIAYLVARYGDFILYRPPLKVATIGLWFGPFILLFFGVFFLLHYIRKSKLNKTN